jgi:hypothetical protein
MTLVEGGSTQELTRVYEAALAEVNRLRVRDGLDKIERLPKGTRSAQSCPLARALGYGRGVNSWVSVGRSSWGRYKDNVRHYEQPQGETLPTALVEFVMAFDADKFPHLKA